MNELGETNLILILAGIVIAFCVTLFFFVRSLTESRARRLAQRLADAGEDIDDGLILREDLSKQPLGNYLEKTGLGITSDQAFGWMTFASVLAASLLFLIRPEWWIGLIGMVLGCGIVWLTFSVFRMRYRSQLQEQLPDMIFLIARSLRAGLSLEQALQLVGDQGMEPLATEFRRANHQIQLGLTIPLAMELMAKRLEVPDFNSLVSTINLYSNTGGNLPLLLDRLAASTRDQNQFRAYFRSATALGRISSMCIAGAGPLFFIGYALFTPDYADFFLTSQVGLLTLGMAALLEIIGLVWLWNIVKIDY